MKKDFITVGAIVLISALSLGSIKVYAEDSPLPPMPGFVEDDALSNCLEQEVGATTRTCVADQDYVYSLSKVIPAGYNITLDLNGHSLTENPEENSAIVIDFNIVNKGNFKIIDSVGGGSIGADIHNLGKMEIAGGTFSDSITDDFFDEFTKETTENYENTETIISGGSFSKYVDLHTPATINNGTFNAALSLSGYNNIRHIINGGKFNGVVFLSSYENKNIQYTINGGIFNLRSFIGHSLGGDINVEINGGEFNGKVDASANTLTSELIINKGNFNNGIVVDFGKMRINDGNFVNKTTPSDDVVQSPTESIIFQLNNDTLSKHDYKITGGNFTNASDSGDILMSFMDEDFVSEEALKNIFENNPILDNIKFEHGPDWDTKYTYVKKKTLGAPDTGLFTNADSGLSAIRIKTLLAVLSTITLGIFLVKNRKNIFHKVNFHRR